MSIKTCKTKLLATQAISDVVFKYTLEKPKGFNFLPGQYINISVSNTARRSYSISSGTSLNYIELIIDISPNGPGSNFFKKLKINQEFEFIGPFGHMFIGGKDLNVGNIIFISTGTGIAPFLSIFNYLDDKKYKGKVFNLYSEKFKKDLIKTEKYKFLKISTIITLTRDIDPCYLNGRVSNHFDKLTFSNNSLFFVCGNNKMVLEACKFLDSKGISKEQIRREVYY